MPLRLTSTAFRQGGDIPQKYTCGGDNVSPPFAWSDVPEGTRSLLLICDDPDAPVKYSIIGLLSIFRRTGAG